MSTTLATILCGQCSSENRRAEKIGTVEKSKSDGRRYWGAIDPKETRRLRKLRIVDLGTQYFREWIALDDTTPDELPAWCKRHGACSVSTKDVRGARGTLRVKIKAAPAGQTGI